MSSKWSSIVQNINPRIAFTLLISFMLLWIFSKPLKYLGENLCLTFGSTLNNSFQTLANTKLSLTDLINSNKKLKEQERTISLLKHKIYLLEDQNSKYKTISSILNLKKSIPYQTFTTKIIGRTPDNWHKQLIIDKGLSSGIKVGDTAFSKKGIVGQVIDVSKNLSFIQLISDPGFKIGCKLKRTNLLGILSGSSHKSAIIEYIPIGSDVKVGDLVVTSGIASGGLSKSYPANHPIGRVSKVSKKKHDNSDLYIEIKLHEDLARITDVLIFSPVI